MIVYYSVAKFYNSIQFNYAWREWKTGCITSSCECYWTASPQVAWMISLAKWLLRQLCKKFLIDSPCTWVKFEKKFISMYLNGQWYHITATASVYQQLRYASWESFDISADNYWMSLTRCMVKLTDCSLAMTEMVQLLRRHSRHGFKTYY